MSVFVFTFFALTLFVARKLYRLTVPRFVLQFALLAGALAAAISIVGSRPSRMQWVWFEMTVPHLLTFVIATLIVYATAKTCFYYLRSSFADRIHTYAGLFGHPAQGRGTGLALSRGVIMGLALSSLWIGIAYVGGPYGLVMGSPVWISSGALMPMGGDSTALIILLETFLLPWLLVGLPLALLAKITRKNHYLLGSLAVLWMVSGFTLAGSFFLPSLAFTFSKGIIAIILGWIFLRYDLLTLCAAALTLETLLVAFPLWVVWRDVNPWPFATALYGWAALVILSLIFLFWPHLMTARRKLAEVFE